MEKIRRQRRQQQAVGTFALSAAAICAGLWFLSSTPLRVSQHVHAAITSQPATRASLGETEPRVHDPCITRDGDTYYVYSTGPGIPGFSSTDLLHWNPLDPVFNKTPQWAFDEIAKDLSPNAHKPTSIWAPDISAYRGEFFLYYCVSTLGSTHSVIGLATNKTLNPVSPNFKWIDHGKVLETLHGDSYNAIDASFVRDADGQPWLAFGSFWTGIKLRKLDPRTGMPDTKNTTLYSLATRPREVNGAIEGPSLIYHDGYYYLFVAFDICCRGADSTYRIMVGRSKEITGPYLDKEGHKMLNGGGSEFLTGDPHGRIRGPGGANILHDQNRWLMVNHFYDATNHGTPKLQLRQLTWTQDAWPITNETLGH